MQLQQLTQPLGQPDSLQSLLWIALFTATAYTAVAVYSLIKFMWITRHLECEVDRQFAIVEAKHLERIKLLTSLHMSSDALVIRELDEWDRDIRYINNYFKIKLEGAS